jgi:hypothetical protein
MTLKNAQLAASKVLNGALKFPKVFSAAAVAVRAAAKEAAEAAAKEVGEKAAEKAGKKITLRIAYNSAKNAAKNMATGALRAVYVGLTVCGAGAAASGGMSCAVGAAVTAIMIAFDVVNMVFAILDPGNISVLMHRDTIDGVAKATMEAMRDGSPTSNYFDEEVQFDILGYFFTTDDEGNLFAADEEVATKWNQLQDEYMKKIGMPANWRESATPIQLSRLSDPGVLDEFQQEIIDDTMEIVNIKPKPIPPKIPTWLIVVLIIIALAILGILAINFFQ